jgi:hypothetical protein
VPRLWLVDDNQLRPAGHIVVVSRPEGHEVRRAVVIVERKIDTDPNERFGSRLPARKRSGCPRTNRPRTSGCSAPRRQPLSAPPGSLPARRRLSPPPIDDHVQRWAEVTTVPAIDVRTDPEPVDHLERPCAVDRKGGRPGPGAPGVPGRAQPPEQLHPSVRTANSRQLLVSRFPETGARTRRGAADVTILELTVGRRPHPASLCSAHAFALRIVGGRLPGTGPVLCSEPQRVSCAASIEVDCGARRSTAGWGLFTLPGRSRMRPMKPSASKRPPTARRTRGSGISRATLDTEERRVKTLACMTTT